MIMFYNKPNTLDFELYFNTMYNHIHTLQFMTFNAVPLSVRNMPRLSLKIRIKIDSRNALDFNNTS